MTCDRFSGRAADITAAAAQLAAVTPDDHADLPDGPCRALFVATAGDIVVSDLFGGVVTLRSADTQYHPVRVRRIHATGTTATGVVALY